MLKSAGYAISAAKTYPFYEDGTPVVGLKHRDVPQFLMDQNKLHGLSGHEALRWPYGFENESLWSELGLDHELFDQTDACPKALSSKDLCI